MSEELIDPEEYDFEKDLEIDKYGLDEECVNQPNLYMKYAKLAAKAKRAYDERWERVKVVKAELIKQAKGTAQEKEAYYRTHKRHRTAKKNMIKAEYVYNVLNAAVFAMQQRKTTLELEVRLWLGEYYADPAHGDLPEDTRERVKSKRKKKVRKEAKKKLNK